MKEKSLKINEIFKHRLDKYSIIYPDLQHELHSPKIDNAADFEHIVYSRVHQLSHQLQITVVNSE